MCVIVNRFFPPKHAFTLALAGGKHAEAVVGWG